MRLFLRKYGQFILLFFYVFYGFLFAYNLFFGDTIVNYGFSYAITRGEVPYVDYNLIVPLFSPLLYSFVLLISKSFFFYYMIQSFLVVLLFVVISFLLKEKWCLLLPIVFLGFPIAVVTILFPGYNFVLLFLLFLVIYCEIQKKNDYLIGFLLGLMFLTKHTLGIFFVLPTLFYWKQPKKIGKRMIGWLLPFVVFLLYLVISGSLDEFLNLCIFGLFDFAGKNATLMNAWLLIPFLMCLGYVIYCIFKKKNDILPYYIVISSLFVFPLFDGYHLSFFIFFTCFLFLYYCSFSNFSLFPYVFIFLLVLAAIWTMITFCFQNGEYSFYSFSNYPFRYLRQSDVDSYQEVQEFMKDWDGEVVLFGLGTENYFYKITNNLDITYFDLPNYGNYGYQSFDFMVEKFESLPKNSVILVDCYAMEDDNNNQQYYKELAQYVVNHYVRLKSVGRYVAYVK